ncbi:RHS repeat domain-containing protein [Rhizobacter sp. OV335]|uniref:RHS repeat domain-containing protein n=1 Tax=Rhizobacter sp. OV335 TaxID=1500264 RepID=UPI0009167F85|nr:RHS repeat-associated core domain-containing protein [Rhizobacter sp. OV335]SHN10815.1 RHS repeat-associated core domain-containing protein [Rhizobacter sp. OV335]
MNHKKLDIVGRGRLLALVEVLACLIGAHAAPAQAQLAAADPANYSRTKSFVFNADGTLQSETSEPANPLQCGVISYEYDGAGNVRRTTTASCAGATGRMVALPRSSYSSYAAQPSQGVTVNGSLTPNATVAIPAGLFVDSTTNALGKSAFANYDPRFGVLSKGTDINQLSSSAVVDDLGRTVQETHVDGTRTLSWHCIVGPGLDTSTNTVLAGAGCPTPASGEAPPFAVRFVHVEPRSTTNAKMGPLVRTYYDALNRQIRTATESFNGPGQPAARAGALVVADVVYDAYGSKVMETKPYFLASGASTTDGSNAVGVTRYTYDELGRMVASHGADPAGSVAKDFGGSGTGYGAYGNRQAAVTTYARHGNTVVVTNDAGQARTEERTARGDLSRVTDALGAQIAFLSDAFGNVIQVRDALQNRITTSYDTLGRKIQTQDPDHGVLTYCYDALGQLKALQNSAMRGSHVPTTCPDVENSGVLATGVSGWTTYAYDLLGRMTHRVEPEFQNRWVYDDCSKGVGKLCQVTRPGDLDKKIYYDELGREISNRLDIANGPSFLSSVGFEPTTGRLASKTYPTGLQVGYDYTSSGHLRAMLLKTAATVSPLPDANGQVAAGKTLPAGSVLWQANVIDALGDIEQDQVGNNVADRTTYDPATGRVRTAKAGIGAATDILDHQYNWSSVNNLLSRIDRNGDGASAVSEVFGFDGLNRLTQYSVSSSSIAGFQRSVTLQYNALGMLLFKTDVGNYAYGSSGPGADRPHLLRSLTGNGTTTYDADLNGNVTAASGGKYNGLSYTSFNNVLTGSGNGAQYAWQYDENHARVKEVRTAKGNTRTLWYLHPDNVGGLGFEMEVNTNPALQSSRHFLSVAGKAIGVLASDAPLPVPAGGQTAPVALDTIALNKVEYWHKDHLGSLSATTDHNGTPTQRYSYDPFGKRRFIGGDYDEQGAIEVDWAPNRNYGTARGFTGHEGLDDIGLINMNGRLYDPTSGLFVQADPEVTNPINLQNYNRYAYVLNNPLNATDPSGFGDAAQYGDNGSCDSTCQHNETNAIYNWAMATGEFGGSGFFSSSSAQLSSSSSNGDGSVSAGPMLVALSDAPGDPQGTTQQGGSGQQSHAPQPSEAGTASKVQIQSVVRRANQLPSKKDYTREEVKALGSEIKTLMRAGGLTNQERNNLIGAQLSLMQAAGQKPGFMQPREVMEIGPYEGLMGMAIASEAFGGSKADIKPAVSPAQLPKTTSALHPVPAATGNKPVRVLKDGEGATPEAIANSVGGPTAGSRSGQQELRQELIQEATVTNGGVFKCWRCGQTSTNPADMHVGHRNVPASKGGNQNKDNICLEGAACNLSAGNRGAPSQGMSCAERGSCGAPYGR